MARPGTSIRIAATAASAAYAAALYVSGVHIQAGAKQALSYLPTAVTFLVTLWDLWIWRLPGLQRLSKRPWIAGTWSATLTPTAASHIPAGGNRGPIEAYIIITQTFWSTGIRQYTAESRSDSIAAEWSQLADRTGNTLTYNYANRPRQEFETRSHPHLGTAALDVVGLRPSTITGGHFTDRYTKGDMTLRLVDRTTSHADYASVREHCQPAQP